MQRAELINLDTSNTNIVEQLRMVTRFPWRVDEEMRDGVINAVKECLQGPPSLRLAAAGLAVKMTQVNASVQKGIATDQVQRHLSFDKKDDVQAAKFAALESMSDEELLVLENLANRAGGSIVVGE